MSNYLLNGLFPEKLFKYISQDANSLNVIFNIEDIQYCLAYGGVCIKDSKVVIIFDIFSEDYQRNKIGRASCRERV